MNQNPWRKKVLRPIGVNIILVLGMLVALRNAAGFYFMLRANEGDVSLTIVIVTFLIILGVGASAVWAFFPHNEARLTFIGFVALFFLWRLLLTFSAFMEGGEQAKEAVLAFVGLAMESLYLIALVWYFMTAKVVAYYKQDD